MKTTYYGSELWPLGTWIQLNTIGRKVYEGFGDLTDFPIQKVKLTPPIWSNTGHDNICAVFSDGEKYQSGWMPAEKRYWDRILGPDDEIFEDVSSSEDSGAS